MNDNEKELIKKVNIDKAKNKIILCFLLMIISLFTYVVPLFAGIFDFGIIFELLTLICIVVTRINLLNYDANHSKKYTTLALLSIGILLVYDFITIVYYTIEANEFPFLDIDFILGEGSMIFAMTLLITINKDLKKADNPEMYSESKNWFYEKIDEKK